MPRSTPVPIYTTLTSTPAPLTTQKRALSTTSPGTTDNTATGVNGGVSGVHAFFRPASAITGVTGSGTTAPSPPTIDDGWLLPINTTLAPTGDGVTFAAGTWTVPYHYSRPGGVLTADVPHTVTVILAQLDSAGTAFKAEVGRSAAQALTATTTEQTFSFSVSGAETVFAPGDILMLMVYIDRPGALTSDTVRCHTNSTTALRITAAPAYTTQFERSLTDAVALSDSMARQATYARAMADTAPVSDGIARVATFPRSLSDSALVADALARSFTGARAMVESMPVSDVLARTYNGSRSIADAMPVSDSIARQFSGFRSLADSMPVADTISRQFIANRNLTDNLTPLADAISRAYSGTRNLSDSVAVSDSLTRAVTYSRLLIEAFREGGGGTTIIRRKRVTIFDKA